MKLYANLTMASTAAVMLVAFAGCTGLPGTTPTPTPTPTPVQAKRTALQYIVFSEFTVPASGRRYVLLKNATEAAAVNVSALWLSFHPTTSDREAVGTISGLSGMAANQTVKVYLSSDATPSAGEYKVTWTGAPTGEVVQWGAGGALALFRGAASTSANLGDFVQWGRTGTQYESAAAAANLWATGSKIDTKDLGATGITLSVITAGATGSANWQYK